MFHLGTTLTNPPPSQKPGQELLSGKHEEGAKQGHVCVRVRACARACVCVQNTLTRSLLFPFPPSSSNVHIHFHSSPSNPDSHLHHVQLSGKRQIRRKSLACSKHRAVEVLQFHTPSSSASCEQPSPIRRRRRLESALLLLRLTRAYTSHWKPALGVIGDCD